MCGETKDFKIEPIDSEISNELMELINFQELMFENLRKMLIIPK